MVCAVETVAQHRSRDGQPEFDRVQPRAKHASQDATLQNAGHHAGNISGIHRFRLRSADVLATMQVLDADKRQEALIFPVVVKGEFCQPIERRNGIRGHGQRFLGVAHCPVSVFQHIPEQHFLAGKMPIDQRLVNAGRMGDGLDVCAFQAVSNKFACRSHQNGLAGAQGARSM